MILRTYTLEHSCQSRAVILKLSNVCITVAHPVSCSAWGDSGSIFLRKSRTASNNAKEGFGQVPWLGSRVFLALAKRWQDDPRCIISSMVSEK